MNAVERQGPGKDRAASPALRGRLLHDEPMARHTSWRVGGPADRYFEPADRDDLITFVRRLPDDEPLLWLGLGSNLLVRDGGWRGTVIALHRALDELRLEGNAHGAPGDEPATIYAEAGVHCARLAKFCEKQRLAGLGFMAGIPGTVGGALAMNAGAWGGETWPNVAGAELLLRDGATRWLTAKDIDYGYRHVALPADALGFLAARFAVTADIDGSHAAATRTQLARRKATQPVGRPSAGSTFRNPPGDFAARLIEAAGLKGHRVGGAQVSEQHANFVITVADARAADVEALVSHVQRVVEERTGIALVPEIRIVGEAE